MKTDFMEHEMNCKELKKHVIFVISMFFFACYCNIEKQIVKNKPNISKCMIVVAKSLVTKYELSPCSTTSKCRVVVAMSAAGHSPPAAASLSWKWSY